MDPIETLLNFHAGLKSLLGDDMGLGIFNDVGAAFVAGVFPLLGFLVGHPKLAALAALGVALLDPYWRAQLGRGGSRFLNSILRGEGDSTLSAWSWELKRRGARTGALRVRLIDALPFNGAGHCESAWRWHRDRGLLEVEDASVEPAAAAG